MDILNRLFNVIFGIFLGVINIVIYTIICIPLLIWAPFEMIGAVLEPTLFALGLYIFTGRHWYDFVADFYKKRWYDDINRPIYITSFPMAIYCVWIENHLLNRMKFPF